MENKTNIPGDALAKDITSLNKDIAALKHDVAKIASDLKHRAEARVDATKQIVTDKIQLAREIAAAKPLLILGVGFFLGFLFALRSRR